MKENKIPVAELKAALCDKRYSYYSGWNGSSRNIIIKTIRRSKQHKGFVAIVGNNMKGEKDTALVSDAVMNALVRHGKYEECKEIDHCSYKDAHNIFKL